MNTQKQKKQFIGAGRFDPVNSTYKHVINLKNNKVLTGYSKGLLFNEMSDKIVLLERVILRLVKNNYLDPARTNNILFYLNGNLTQTEELILKLNPTDYNFAERLEIVSDKRLFTFLDRLYSQLITGEIITKSLSHKPTKGTQSEIFSLVKKRFSNEMDLHKFITTAEQSGHPRGLCQAFYWNYKNKFDI